MIQPNLIASIAGISLASVTLVMAAVGVGPRSSLFSPEEYAAAAHAIAETARKSSGACRKLPAADRALCFAEAAAEERVRKAELEARYTGTYEAAYQAQLARLDAAFEVEALRCSAFVNEERRICVGIAAEQRNASIANLRKPT